MLFRSNAKPIKARPVTAFVKFQKWVSRNKLVAYMSMFVIVLFCSGIGYYIVDINRRNEEINKINKTIEKEKEIAESRLIESMLNSIDAQISDITTNIVLIKSFLKEKSYVNAYENYNKAKNILENATLNYVKALKEIEKLAKKVEKSNELIEALKKFVELSNNLSISITFLDSSLTQIYTYCILPQIGRASCRERV